MSADLKDFALMLDDLVRERLNLIETGVVGSVQSFTATEFTAGVQPRGTRKFPDGSSQPYPALSKVPILSVSLGNGFYHRPRFAAGDLVLIGFSLRAVDGALRGSDSDEFADGSLHNAIVLGGLKKPSQTFQAFTKPGILIGHKDGGHVRYEQNEINVTDDDNDDWLTIDQENKEIKADFGSNKTVSIDEDGIHFSDALQDVKFGPGKGTARTNGYMTPLGPTISLIPGLHEP